MQLYSEWNNYKLYHWDMLDMLDVIEKWSIDSIVTDPPYWLTSIVKRFGKDGSAPAKFWKDGSFARLSKGFMGKEWDWSWIEYNVDAWRNCYEVLKPWGYLLAFWGSRTFYRIACAIEDAWFEIRDTIMWLYGCYSADTEVLTNSWWKKFTEIDKWKDKVLQRDSKTWMLSRYTPTNFFEYDIDDELVNFKNRNTDQLITKNHRVYWIYKDRRKPKWDKYEVRLAWDIKKTTQIDLPLSWIMDWDKTIKHPYLVWWWLTDAWKHRDGKACMFSQSKPETLNKLRNYLDKCWAEYSEYIKESKNPKHRNEHTFYVHWEIAEYLLSNYNDRELKRWMLDLTREDKEKLLEWLMDWDWTQWEWRWYSKVFWSKKQERLDIFQALCLSLWHRTHLWDSCVYFNIDKGTTQIQFCHKHENVRYTGKVYCLETEEWAFVLRRNWKAFISWNSWFPKSLNIWLAIDKKNWVESIDTGIQSPNARPNCDKTNTLYKSGTVGKNFTIKKATNKWAWRWTSLKPSYEPIIVARKPCEWSCTDNVIKYWVGGINIDECRVGDDVHKVNINDFSNQHWNKFWNWEPIEKMWEKEVCGRFPANTILTYDETDFDEVCGEFPITKWGITKEKWKFWICFWEWERDSKPMADWYWDSWSACRYFYCAKASRRDRDEGLPEWEHSTHPTVKPTNLMQYLVRLITPNGWTVLDPFNWSGSTGKAVMYENKDRNKNYKYIWIELTEEYLPIAKARIEYVAKQDDN